MHNFGGHYIVEFTLFVYYVNNINTVYGYMVVYISVYIIYISYTWVVAVNLCDSL